MKLIALEEYSPCEVNGSYLPTTIGEEIWRRYGSQLAVDFPSPQTNGNWRFTSQGWVGHLPLSAEWQLVIQPKVPIANLFRMLEYAYQLDLTILEGATSCDTMLEFYERLAHILALRILDRGRKGFYRAYLSESNRLPTVRGRLDTARLARSPWAVQPFCHFQKHTGDVVENQLLIWTLFIIARSGWLSQRVSPTVRRAYHALQHYASLQEYSGRDCINRHYNRLNQDYKPMHALCRFFLENSGPSAEQGASDMLPFLVNMAQLFEMFVAQWLREHLPNGWSLRGQEPFYLPGSSLRFDIDLVLYDEANQARCVLDTKYKAPTAPSTNDVAQVVAYATAKKCTHAVLLYPTPLVGSLQSQVGNIRVSSLTFDLKGDLETAGQLFLHNLLLSLTNDQS